MLTLLAQTSGRAASGQRLLIPCTSAGAGSLQLNSKSFRAPRDRELPTDWCLPAARVLRDVVLQAPQHGRAITGNLVRPCRYVFVRTPLYRLWVMVAPAASDGTCCGQVRTLGEDGSKRGHDRTGDCRELEWSRARSCLIAIGTSGSPGDRFAIGQVKRSCATAQCRRSKNTFRLGSRVYEGVSSAGHRLVCRVHGRSRSSEAGAGTGKGTDGMERRRAGEEVGVGGRRSTRSKDCPRGPLRPTVSVVDG
ncbi:hypothetical protein PYCCODRAFT_480849 [Trametes coccinea BRFM310]|uniref:Uncharacterized protein n=1 Tax=Trametes coccinea (strain BRFM310) TaxID=1353009 RepID=A0A1Y2IL20_TRAC3|nr:hypothetical protein PYCCODRAFT_480849 [Trametes coccinea BRFM310]